MNEKEPVVRVGNEDDLDAMMKFVMSATDENAFIQPDIMKLLNDVWGALTQQTGIVGIIGEPGEKIEGAVLLNIGTVWYSSDQVIEEKAIFVDPEYRSAKGGRAKKLVDFSKAFADKMGKPLAIGVLSNSRTEAKIRMYERIFGAPAGVFFLYGATTGAKKET
jgi:GNAT superfamily N-acetyltransferase